MRARKMRLISFLTAPKWRLHLISHGLVAVVFFALGAWLFSPHPTAQPVTSSEFPTKQELTLASEAKVVMPYRRICENERGSWFSTKEDKVLLISNGSVDVFDATPNQSQYTTYIVHPKGIDLTIDERCRLVVLYHQQGGEEKRLALRSNYEIPRTWMHPPVMGAYSLKVSYFGGTLYIGPPN